MLNRILNIICLIALILINCSCSSIGTTGATTQKLNPEIYYRNDICFEYEIDAKTAKLIKSSNKHWNNSFGAYKYVKGSWGSNGVLKFCGVGVLPFKKSYKLKVISYSKLNFFTITTCHLEDTTENSDRGIFKKNGEIEINYVPTLERGKACPLYLSAYSKNNKSAFGILAFEDPRFKLEATVYCNGYTSNSTGVSICQSRAKLLQKIVFNEVVKPITPVKGGADKKDKCPILESKDFKTFLFKLPSRECIYGFIGIKSKKIHKLYTIGYESLIIRD